MGLCDIFKRAAAQPVISEDQDYMARTMWGEARGEGINGMTAVGWVILNRVKDRRWPNSVKGVVTQRLQFSAWNANDPNRARLLSVTDADPQFKIALAIAGDILAGRSVDITGGADHYHATTIRTPSWARELRQTAKIGAHVFYS